MYVYAVIICVIICRRGVLLCKDSNHSEWIYVIKSGTCKVLKDLIETKPNIPGLEIIPYTINQTDISEYVYVIPVLVGVCS